MLKLKSNWLPIFDSFFVKISKSTCYDFWFDYLIFRGFDYLKSEILHKIENQYVNLIFWFESLFWFRMFLGSPKIGYQNGYLFFLNVFK